MDEFETGVLAILQEFKFKTVPLSAELYHDLHICTDDAGELLEAVHKKYNTSFEGFRFDKYFPFDGEALPAFSNGLA